ncbi:hypothetical protein JST97_18230 [bacterium]|nr:hypothetical protein [bacterium]
MQISNIQRAAVHPATTSNPPAAASAATGSDTFQPSQPQEQGASLAQLLGMLANQGVSVDLQQAGASVADTSLCQIPQGDSQLLEQLKAPVRAAFGDQAVLDLKDSRITTLRAFHVDKNSPEGLASILGDSWMVHNRNDYATSYQLEAPGNRQARQRVTVNRDGFVNLHTMAPREDRTMQIHSMGFDRQGQCQRNENWVN